MFIQLFFSKVHPVCHNIANSIKLFNQEVTLKRLISMLWIAQKLYVGAEVIYVRCINWSYNNVAKGIRLLDSFISFELTPKVPMTTNVV